MAFGVNDFPNNRDNQNTEKSRKDVIMHMIERNPGIIKTKLAKSVSEHMSLKTAFQTIDDLKQEGKIFERKHGKKKRYYPMEEDQAKLADEIDDFIKNLSDIKEECFAYPLDLSNPIRLEIIRQKDSLLHDITMLQRDLDYHEERDDIMQEYNHLQSMINKLMYKANFDLKRKVNECLGSIHNYLNVAASRYVTCKSERAKYGMGKKRNSLSDEINRLEIIIANLIRYTRSMRDIIKDLEPKNQKRLFDPPLDRDLKDAGQEMKNLQDMVRGMIDKVVKRRAVYEGGEKLEIGLEKVKDMLKNIADELVAAKEEFDKAYRANLISKTEQKLHLQIKEINEYVISLPPPDTTK